MSQCSNHLVSVIIPAYNLEEYLQLCLDSLKCQTHHNIEVLVIDDGSSDCTLQIANNYASDKRFHVISQAHGGISSARNHGLELASGEYYMFVDGDDFVEPTFCETALSLALRHQVDCVAFGYNRFHDTTGETISRVTRSPRLLSKEDAIQEVIETRDILNNYVWNKLYYRRLFDEIRFPLGRNYEDVAIMYLIMHRLSTKVYVSDELLYHYRCQRKDSVSFDPVTPEAIHDRLQNELERLEFIQSHYPDLEVNQINAAVSVCILGLTRMHRADNSIVQEVKSFLWNNRNKVLSSSTGLRKIRMFAYYFCPPLFHLINVTKDAIFLQAG